MLGGGRPYLSVMNRHLLLAATARVLAARGAHVAVAARTVADLELVVKDDRGTPEGARAAAEEALKDGAELILGPLLSQSVQAAAAVARGAAHRERVVAREHNLVLRRR